MRLEFYVEKNVLLIGIRTPGGSETGRFLEADVSSHTSMIGPARHRAIRERCASCETRWNYPSRILEKTCYQCISRGAQSLLVSPRLDCPVLDVWQDPYDSSDRPSYHCTLYVC